MALYRNVAMSFWTDGKVIDDFTPEDKYFYLYLFTNPHTNLAGCYEISLKQVEIETGYARETIENLIARFERVHNVIRYSKETKEILLVNWHKYNWTSSEKFCTALMEHIEAVKCLEFREYLEAVLNGSDTVSIPYPYDMDTRARTDAVTVTDTETVTETVTEKKPSKQKTSKQKKDRYDGIPEELIEPLKEFEKMRRSIKKPMTDRAFTILVNNVNKLSGGDTALAIEIIEQSILNSWPGVYPLKGNRNENNNGVARPTEPKRTGIDWNSFNDLRTE